MGGDVALDREYEVDYPGKTSSLFVFIYGLNNAEIGTRNASLTLSVETRADISRRGRVQEWKRYKGSNFTAPRVHFLPRLFDTSTNSSRSSPDYALLVPQF